MIYDHRALPHKRTAENEPVLIKDHHEFVSWAEETIRQLTDSLGLSKTLNSSAILHPCEAGFRLKYGRTTRPLISAYFDTKSRTLCYYLRDFSEVRVYPFGKTYDPENNKQAVEPDASFAYATFGKWSWPDYDNPPLIEPCVNNIGSITLRLIAQLQAHLTYCKKPPFSQYCPQGLETMGGDARLLTNRHARTLLNIIEVRQVQTDFQVNRWATSYPYLGITSWSDVPDNNKVFDQGPHREKEYVLATLVRLLSTPYFSTTQQEETSL